MARSVRQRRDAYPDADLATWVAAAKTGDTDAFGWIWQALSPRVNGYLRGRGIAASDDVTSEVFLAAFTSLGSFSGDGTAFRSWLFTIAHHKAVDVVRRRKDHAEYTAEGDPRTSASAEQDALDGIVDAEVRAMLSALTDEQREVLLLRTLGDMSLEQVAEVTGRTVGAVKQLHHRAVATARRAAWSTGQALGASGRRTSSLAPVTSGAAATMTET